MKETGGPAVRKPKTALSADSILAFLESAPLLAGLSEAELREVADNCRVSAWSKGSIIFKMNEPSNWMYLVYGGHIAEFVGYGSSVDIIVKLRKRFDYIGEMGMLIDEAYTNTAVALDDVLLLGLSRESFLRLAWKQPSITKYIIRELIDRLTKSCAKMINSMYLDAPGKLAFTLVELSNNLGNPAMDITVTQADLAASAGVARQTVARILGDWRKNGWISTLRGKIGVTNLDALLEVIVSSELR